MLLLGLSGRANHGKSTAADAIMCHAMGLHTISYDIGGAVLNYAIEQNLLPNKKRSELTKPEVQTLADLGKQLREYEGEDFWIEKIFQQIDKDNPDVAIIPNVRYLNEAQWVKRRRGYIIRVQKVNADGSEFISDTRDPNHQSETDLWNYPWDFVLRAHNGDSAWLEEQAIGLFNYLEAIHG